MKEFLFGMISLQTTTIFFLSAIFYLKERTTGRLLLSLGLFIYLIFSITWMSSDSIGQIILIWGKGLFPIWFSKGLLVLGKIMIVIGFYLSIFKRFYKEIGA